MARLQRERSSKTLMYVMFLFAAGAVVAPLIFGFVSQISVTVININNTTGVEALSPLDFIIFGAPISILWLYLMIECTISGIMISFVRGAKVWRGLLFYSLSMMLVSTIVFEVSRIIAAGMLATSSSGAAFA
jgi:archaellum biogenesis protein FlaJ (TadC family)